MSKYHFHRIFKTFVGESTHDYLRKRRLTEAAQQLLFSDSRILDIALQHNYGSQEAFSRAFKTQFGITPGEYRKMGQQITLERPRLTPNTLRHLHQGMILEPQLVENPEYTVVGLRGCCTVPSTEHQLRQMWDHLIPRLSEIPNMDHPPVFVGIHEFLPDINRFYNTKYYYLVSVLAPPPEPLPSGMVSKTIPAGKCAIFTHKEPSLSRLEVDRYIHGTWFPNSRYKRAKQDIVLEIRENLSEFKYYILIPIM